MGSKVTRIINQNQRNRPVDQKSVPLLIKCLIVGLSLLSAFCLGFIKNSSPPIRNIESWLSNIIIGVGVSSLLCFIRLDKLLIRAALVVLLSLILGDGFQMLTLGGSSIIYLTIFVIVYGEIGNATALFIQIYFIVEQLGHDIVQMIKQHSKNPNSFAVVLLFGVLLVMSIFMIVSGMFYTKTKHPVPLPLGYLYKALRLHKECLKYGSIILVLTITLKLPLQNQHMLGYNFIGFFIPVMIAFLSIFYIPIKHVLVALTIILQGCLMLEFEVYWLYRPITWGWIAYTTIESMNNHRIIGIITCFITYSIGTIIILQTNIIQQHHFASLILVSFAALIWLQTHRPPATYRKNYLQVNNNDLIS